MRLKLAGCLTMSLLAAALVAARAAEDVSPSDVLNAEAATENRIQGKVLDLILGPGKASVFVQARLEIYRSRAETRKFGRGQMKTEKAESGAVKGSTDPVSGQYAEQSKAEEGSSQGATLRLGELTLKSGQ